jgi:hypothetical protein
VIQEFLKSIPDKSTSWYQSANFREARFWIMFGEGARNCTSTFAEYTMVIAPLVSYSFMA